MEIKEPNTPFKILSIDGGGIKGLYSARILNKFEIDLRNKYGTQARVVDYFDLICGTSTGGFIALALSAGIPTEKICAFYEAYGPKIFKHSTWITRTLKQVFWKGKYSDRKLKRALTDMFGNKKIGDSHSLLCIPTFIYTQNTYEIFKYDHKEGNLNRDNILSMVDVALATSAAPTYFPLAEISELNNLQFIDGGVWANNPSLVGFTEAIRYFVGPEKRYKSMQILSIASLSMKKGRAPKSKRNKSFINFKDDLFDFCLTGQSEFADIFLNSVKNNFKFPVDYIRVPSVEFSTEQEKYIGLDIATPKSLLLMNQSAQTAYDQYKHMQLIKNIFETQKTYNVNE